MNGEDIEGFILIFLALFCILITFIFLLFDWRMFYEVAKQCESVGFIQNHSTRIICSLEKTK